MVHVLPSGMRDGVCSTVQLCNSVLIPVVAQDIDVLALQHMLDDMDRMSTHCLDLNDLIDLFQSKSGEWATLSVWRCTSDDNDSFSALIEIAKTANVGRFLFRSLTSGKQISHTLHTSDALLLFTPVIADVRINDEILLVTKA